MKLLDIMYIVISAWIVLVVGIVLFKPVLRNFKSNSAEAFRDVPEIKIEPKTVVKNEIKTKPSGHESIDYLFGSTEDKTQRKAAVTRRVKQSSSNEEAHRVASAGLIGFIAADSISDNRGYDSGSSNSSSYSSSDSSYSSSSSSDSGGGFD